MNYLRTRQKELINVSGVDNSLQLSIIEPDLNKQQEDLDFLKTCVVNDVSRDVLILKLNSTRELRDKIMKDEGTDIRECFPFFFADPKLVCLIVLF